jgi:hypothetical protein
MQELEQERIIEVQEQDPIMQEQAEAEQNQVIQELE